MTSNNVANYIIYDLDGNEVGSHRQHVMCKTNHDGLEKFQPAKDYTISYRYIPNDDDEYDDEIEEETEPINLETWIKSNPAEFTYRKFKVDDRISWNRGKNTGVVINVTEGKWNPVYEVKTETGETVMVNQTEIKP